MEHLPSGSQTVHNDIRSVQSNIQAQIEDFEISAGTSFRKTSDVCDKVVNYILHYEDEPHLSRIQNNYRRIFIASELFINLCSVYANIVDYEFAKIISDIMEWEKYKQLSRRISSRMQLELQKEKYFIKEAQERLLEDLEEADIEDIDEFPATRREGRESETEILTMYGGKSLPANLEQVEVAGATLSQEINGILAPPAPPLETSFTNDPSNLAENLSVIREGVTAETFQLESVLDTLEPKLPSPHVERQASIGEPTLQQKSDDEIDKILQILEDQTFQKDKGEIEQPDNFPKPGDKTQEIQTEVMAMGPPVRDGVPAVASEGSEEWSLPSLEEIEKTKRKRLIIDKEITIPYYAARALKLNRNIQIERVQVFEGPPKILRAISASHLMTTPGRKRSPFHDVRSSKLSTLYNRHLEVEERPVEHPLLQRRIEELSAFDISKARTEPVEDVGVRTGMHSIHEKSDVLIEVQDRSRPEIDIPSDVAPPQESLIGIPISRIINSTIEPPEKDEMERINAAPILSGPRVQQLQGKSLEPRTSPPWFNSTYQSPPSSKYRNFNHVYEKLEKYWTLLGYQEEEKCITLREFFHSEGHGNVADFLTVLRIVDKMSLQRKLILEYKAGDVIIRPFESPYVSDAQLLLKGKEPVL